MILLNVNLNAGRSIFDQLVFAAIKAFVSGDFQPGQPFPSGRMLAADLKIHPNTAHKAIQHLVNEMWLEMKPGIGTVVASRPHAKPGEKARLLKQEVEQLVVGALRIGVSAAEIVYAIEDTWEKLNKSICSNIDDYSDKKSFKKI